MNELDPGTSIRAYLINQRRTLLRALFFSFVVAACIYLLCIIFESSLNWIALIPGATFFILLLRGYTSEFRCPRCSVNLFGASGYPIAQFPREYILCPGCGTELKQATLLNCPNSMLREYSEFLKIWRRERQRRFGSDCFSLTIETSSFGDPLAFTLIYPHDGKKIVVEGGRDSPNIRHAVLDDGEAKAPHGHKMSPILGVSRGAVDDIWIRKFEEASTYLPPEYRAFVLDSLTKRNPSRGTE